MRPNRTFLPLATSLVFVLTAFAARATAQDAELPPLSEEIRTVLERDGVEAAERRFDEIFPAQKDQYEIDMDGMAELARGYLTEGDYESGQAIMRMVTEISREMMPGMVDAAAAEQAREAREERERERAEAEARKEAEAESRRASPDPELGRDDLARFAGVYGDPDRPESRGELWVSQSCGGILVVGAMKGDVANWWMESAADNVFEGTMTSGRSFRIEFELQPDGTAKAMSHDLDGLVNPLVKLGPLPEGWGECIRPRGGY